MPLDLGLLWEVLANAGSMPARSTMLPRGCTPGKPDLREIAELVAEYKTARLKPLPAKEEDLKALPGATPLAGSTSSSVGRAMARGFKSRLVHRLQYRKRKPIKSGKAPGRVGGFERPSKRKPPLV